MSKTIDSKVVEMKFDNKNFEANVAKSMSTLDKLKNSLKLDKASKSFEDLDKASKNLSFNNLNSGIEILQKRFSTLGIIGTRVLENMTDSVMRLASKTTSFVTDGIIQGGKNRAMNLENAHFQLQGLLKDEAAVQAVMKNVNDSVDGTAYSLDSAAKVASQLAASGMRAGDQMFHSLRAVAGVAAMTNSEYDEIGNIFTKVAGQSRLMGDDLLSLSSRGMNAAASISTYFNSSKENLDKFYEMYSSTAKKTDEQIKRGTQSTEKYVRTMISNGAMDFQTFAEAMDSCFGEHAKKANETFTGALSNIRAALARIGALFISPLVEQNGSLVKMFNAIRQRINDVKSSIQPLADLFVKAVTSMADRLTAFLEKLDIKTPLSKLMSGLVPAWDQFSAKLESAGISVTDFQSKLTEVASTHGVSVDELITKYGSLGKAISSGKISNDIIVETLKNFISTGQEVSVVTDNITNKLEIFNRVVGQIINGDYGNGAARVKALTDAGYEYADMQKLVNYVWKRNGRTWKDCNITAEELTSVISDLSSEELQNIGYTQEQANKIKELAEEAEKTGTPLNELISNMTKPTGKELIIDSFRNALAGLSTIISTVRSAWSEMVKPFSTDIFTKIAIRINNLSQKLIFSESNADKLKRTIKGLFSALDLIRSIISGGLRIAFRLLSAILNTFNLNILDVTAYIGDAITKFRNWIKETDLLGKAINIVVPLIKSASEAVVNWVKNNQLIQNGIKGLIPFLDSLKGNIGKLVDNLKNIGNVTKYITAELINGIKNNTSNVLGAMTDLSARMSSTVKNAFGTHSLNGFYNIGKNAIGDFAKGIKAGIDSGISGLFSILNSVSDGCKNILSSLDLGTIVVVGGLAGVFYTINHFIDILKEFANPLKGIEDMTSSIGDFFGALTDSIKPDKWSTMSKTVLELALSIGILSASVYALSTLETGKLWATIGAIGALSAILVGLSLAVSKMNVSGGGFRQLALMFVGLSASLYVMSAAMKKLEFLNKDNMGPIIGGLITMILGLSAVLLAMGRLTKGSNAVSIGRAGITILAISSSIMLMAEATKMMSKLELGDMTKGLICITLFSGLITGLMAATKLAGKYAARFKTTILGISASMLLMIGVIKLSSRLEPEEIAKGTICMTLFGGLITGLMAATKLAGGSEVGKLGTTLLGASAAMMMMSLTIEIVKNMEPEEIAKGIICVTLLGGLVAGLVAATRLAGGNELKGVAVTLLAMSAAIGILAAVAVGLSFVSIEGLAKGIVAVGMLSAMMTAMIYATNGAQKCTGNIIAMTVAIGLMATAVAALSFIDTKKLITATVSLSAVMGMFALIEGMAQYAKGSIGSIITITLAVTLLAGILYVLADIPSESLIPTTVSLSVMLLSMSGALAILSKMGQISVTAIGALALLGVIVAEIGAILGLMSHFNVQPSIETTVSLSALLLAMSGSLAILTAVGAGGPAAFIGIGALATLITGIGGIMVGIGALTTYIPDMQKWLDDGIGALEKIGYGLGTFVGNIAGGLIGGMSSGLPQVGENLSQFMQNLQPFFETLNGIDKNSTEAAKTLAETVLILTGAGLAENLASLLTGSSSISDFSEQLSSFGGAVKAYGDAVAGINIDGIQDSVIAGKALAELADMIPNSGGILGAFVGGNNIDDFGERIAGFASGIKAYCDEVRGIDVSGAQDSINAGKALAELADMIPNSGGILGAFVGGNNINDFGNRIASFASGIKAYCTEVVGIDTSGVQASVTAGKALAELANGLPNNGAVASWFAGDNTIDDFGNRLSTFASGIKAYCTEVIGIDTSGVQASITAGKALSELANGLPNSGGLAEKFAGNNNIDDFGNRIVGFARGIKAYCDEVSGINVANVEDSINAAKKLTEVSQLSSVNNIDMSLYGSQIEGFSKKIKSAVSNLEGIDSGCVIVVDNFIKVFSNISPSNNDLDSYGDKVKSFSEKISEASKTISGASLSETASELENFAASLANLGTSSIDSFVSAFESGIPRANQMASYMTSSAASSANSNAGSFNTVGSNMANNLASGMSAGNGAVQGAGSSLGQAGASGASNQNGVYSSTGNTLSNALSSGIGNGRGTASSAGSSLGQAGATGARGAYSGFSAAGSYIASGLASGISGGRSSVISAAVSLATSALNAARNALGIQSPSRAFMAIGRYIGEGLAIGIRDSAYKAVYATEEMAKEIERIAAGSFDDIKEWIDNAKAFDEIGLTEQLTLWNKVIERYAEGTDERLEAEKNAYSVYKELLSEKFNNSKNWIDKEKEYNRISLQEEYEAWKRMQSEYIDGTDERTEADKNVYKLKHELIDGNVDLLQEEINAQKTWLSTLQEGSIEYSNTIKEIEYLNKLLREAEYQNSENWIDEQEDYDKFNLSSRLAAYTRVLNEKGKHDETIRKKYQKKVYDAQKAIFESYQKFESNYTEILEDAEEQRLQLKQEYADKEAEINEKLKEDIESLENSYTDALESRTDSLYSSYGLFDEVSKKEKVTASSLMKNLQDQVSEFEDWNSTLNSLSGRGLNEDLIDELQEMGPSSVAQIKALSSMTDSQLSEYATLWATKHREAKNRAIEELEDMRISTNSQIDDLRKDAADDLKEYTATWNTKLQELDNSVSEQLVELRTNFGKEVGIITTDTEQEFAEMTAAVSNILRSSGWREDGRWAGKNLVYGLGEGINSVIHSYYDTLSGTVVTGGLDVIHDGYEEHSPSKATERIGRHLIEGLIIGISNNSNGVTSACSNICDESLSAMNKMVGIINGDIDVSPTIRPVLDLSDVNKGLSVMNSLISESRSAAISYSIAKNQNGNSKIDKMINGLIKSNVQSDNKVVNAINGLKNDFAELVNEISNLQLVMDTGSLVGAISPEIDKSLGAAASMRKRGV